MALRPTTLLLSLLLVLLAYPIAAQTHRLATFNIRWDNPNDVGNLWKDRATQVIQLIQFHQIGIVGTQEVLAHQLTELNKSNQSGFS